MIIETTLNIQNHLLKKINNAAHRKGLSRIELIILLFKKVMDDTPHHVCHGKRIKYQSRNNHGIWNTLHIRLRPNDYECLLDLRKLLKMSVSHILAMAVDKYLDELMKTTIKDKYHFTNYILIKETINGILCWKLIWGFPANMGILFHDY
ncbi:MAG: hypothetical protein KA369_22390 [Spirochaetes bacterium]|nr:hypothetical protein [Spirochaetota bacterium]